MNSTKRRRGRPLGFRLSDDSKKAISMSKTGQQHRPETKDKISRSLITYFRKKNPLSEEISARYFRVMDRDALEWMRDVEDDLDSFSELMTDRAIKNKCKIEITCGHNIEYFSHNITPELIYLFKEYCEVNNVDPEDLLEDLI